MKFKDLNRNGIFLSERPAREEELPGHIEKLRTSVLDFTCTVDDGEKSEAISLAAERLDKGKDREPEWARFFARHFFDPLLEEVKVKDEDTRQ
jgi:hypothetical protein